MRDEVLGHLLLKKMMSKFVYNLQEIEETKRLESRFAFLKDGKLIVLVERASRAFFFLIFLIEEMENCYEKITIKNFELNLLLILFLIKSTM